MKLTKSQLKKIIKEEIQNLNEIDFDKVQLPSKVKRFMGKFVDSMKDAKLNRMKRSAILYKVIQAAGISTQTLMADIQLIKQGLKKEVKIKEDDGFANYDDKGKDTSTKFKKNKKTGAQKVKEGNLSEDFKNNEWEVYVADEKGKEKIVKVAKSKRAGVILYNKLINSDKYHEVGMRVIKEEKLKETLNKLTEKLSKSEIKKMRDKFDKTGKLPPHLVKLAKLIDKHTEIKNVIVPGLEWMADIDEGKITEAKETIFDVAAKVMKDSQNYNYKSKKGMVKVDMQTANLLTKVWKKVSPQMKKHLAGMGESNPAGLVQTLWAAVK